MSTPFSDEIELSSVPNPAHGGNLNTDWPKITIITPSYNQGQYIEQTILSVLDQSYPNLEYIIIDGGSTDQTLEIIKKYEDLITYWVSELDRGQSHAINKGLEKCTGDIINWLNSDDWLLPGTLHKVASAFQTNQDVMVVSGYENHVWPDGHVELSEGTYLRNTLEETIELCQIDQPSTFFRASAFKAITPVPEDMHYIMDGELWVRFLLMYGQKRFLKLPVALVNFRYHENSKTISNNIVNNFLYERSSIIVDLQKFISLPNPIINHWVNNVYNTPIIYDLNRNWNLNYEVIRPRSLRIYFIKKYINNCFQYRKNKEAKWGIYQLLRNFCLDKFLLKSFLKMTIRLLI
ncbi:glycosyltransferase family 2 protein [Pontibacter sp. MBLB2868]|uniref:glycosyltransferase family 2 protein n=1 Tax=Pontibacter sp. MBLB2868 TaxID=3451555 RepID=UPI003F74CC78